MMTMYCQGNNCDFSYTQSPAAATVNNCPKCGSSHFASQPLPGAAPAPQPDTDLIRVGSQMSNLCFNLSQGLKVTDDHRARMKELCKEWDKAYTFHRATLAAAPVAVPAPPRQILLKDTERSSDSGVYIPANFVSDYSLPSCHVCGEMMKGVCPKCGATTGVAVPAEESYSSCTISASSRVCKLGTKGCPINHPADQIAFEQHFRPAALAGETRTVKEIADAHGFAPLSKEQQNRNLEDEGAGETRTEAPTAEQWWDKNVLHHGRILTPFKMSPANIYKYMDEFAAFIRSTAASRIAQLEREKKELRALPSQPTAPQP